MDTGFGKTIVEPLGTEGPFEVARVTWTPEKGATSRDGLVLPSLEFHALIASNGDRRIVPTLRPTFVLQADVVGHELRLQSGDLDEASANDGRLLRLLVQHSPQIRETLCRSIKRRRDLELTRSERPDAGRVDVLPEDVGIAPCQEEGRWTVADLLAAGRDIAQEEEIEEPDEETLIRLGFYAAAKRHPFDTGTFSSEDARGLVHAAMWDFGPSSAKPEERLRVRQRLVELLERHLADDNEQFDEWFFRSRDTIIRGIAKRKSGGGPIEREVVRQALLELVRDAHESLAENVAFAMRDFERSLEQPLNDREREMFSLLYLQNDWLGGYPLVLLWEYVEFVREAVLNVFANPRDPRARGTLLRMLWFHGDTIRRKRESERYYKRSRKPR